MTLYEGEVGVSYSVQGLSMEDGLTRRLQALGLNEGTRVKILNRKKQGALILSVRGTRLAVGKHITDHIEVCAAQENSVKEKEEGD